VEIEIENLTEAGRPFEKTYAAGELSLEDEHARLAGGVRVWGKASRKRGVVRLRGSLQTAVELPCDRCLGPVPAPVNVGFAADFGEAAGEPSESAELQDEDLYFAPLRGDAVDLDEIVREQILLALPARQLCRDDCKGLCQSCGADLNQGACDCPPAEVDPRWAALKELKNRDEG
jgi:uncharacterized protein